MDGGFLKNLISNLTLGFSRLHVCMYETICELLLKSNVVSDLSFLLGNYLYTGLF